MQITRREILALTAFGAMRVPRLRAQAKGLDEMSSRIATVIREYEGQGFHRTGTAVDAASGRWLADQVTRVGLTPELEPFPLSRVDPVSCVAVVGDRRIEGVPLFDGTFTDPSGLRGRLGPLGDSTDIALVSTAVNQADNGALGAARRGGMYKALVAVTQGRHPGLCPSNADRFPEAYGPPVLQVSSEEATWLQERAAQRAPIQLVAHVNRTAASADNVATVLRGSDDGAAPFVVMTPRSGWYWCASERGGGIAAWLEIMRALKTRPVRRTVLFVASSGHELGHMGIDAFIERRPGVVKRAVGWLHLGANIGAASEPANTLQAADDQLDAAMTRAMTDAGLTVTRRTPRGTVPGGEAEAVFHGGGRFVSVIGGNGRFHNLDDRGPEAIDASAIAKFSVAFTAFVRTMANA
jgi:hypothetical protein